MKQMWSKNKSLTNINQNGKENRHEQGQGEKKKKQSKRWGETSKAKETVPRT